MSQPDTFNVEQKPETFAVVPSENSPGTVEGYAVRYGVNSSDRGGYVVRFEQGSMRLPTGRDVRALYSHDEAQVLGRTGNGTLKLLEDNDGVRFELTLPNTHLGRDVAELIRRRDIAGMSFGMFPRSHRWEQDADGTDVKIVEAWEMDETTITANPAFTQTTAQLKAAGETTNYGQMSEQTNNQEGEAMAEQTNKPGDAREVFEAKKAEAKAILAAVRDESRGMTDEERDQFAALKSELSAMRDNDKAERELAELELEQYERQARADVKAVATAPHSPRIETKPQADDFAIHTAQVERFLRTGTRPEQFIITTDSGGSGVLLPKTVADPYVIGATTDAFRRALFSRGLRPDETDNVNEYVVPVWDDSGNAAVAIEEDDTTERNQDPAVLALKLGAQLYDSRTVWFSNTALSAMPNILNRVRPMIERRLDAARETAMVGKINTITNTVTAAATDGVTYDELLDLQHALTDNDRRTGVFVVSDQFFRAIRGLTDTTGQPIYQASLRADAPDVLLGWPIFVSGAMSATLAADVVPALALSAEAILIRDVTSGPAAARIARYESIPTHPDQVGLRGFANGDGAFHASGAAKLVMAAAA